MAIVRPHNSWEVLVETPLTHMTVHNQTRAELCNLIEKLFMHMRIWSVQQVELVRMPTQNCKIIEVELEIEPFHDRPLAYFDLIFSVNTANVRSSTHARYTKEGVRILQPAELEIKGPDGRFHLQRRGGHGSVPHDFRKILRGLQKLDQEILRGTFFSAKCFGPRQLERSAGQVKFVWGA
jgi:hypothetical protein